MSAQVYTDPSEPGAPQVGDLVVDDYDRLARLRRWSESDLCPSRWLVLVTWVENPCTSSWCVQVRHLTPEELAAHQLSQGAR